MSRIPKLPRQACSNFRVPPHYGTELRKRVVLDQNRIDLANKYFVSDLPGATIPATRLQNILENIELGGTLSEYALIYLQQHGLTALQQFAQGEITYEAFCKLTLEEQIKREQAAEAKRQKEDEYAKEEEAIRNAKYERDCQRAEEARRKRESAPEYIAKIKNQQLRSGDTLHVHSIDRLARNLKDLQTIVDDLKSKGVSVNFHKENLIFDASINNPMQQFWNPIKN